MIANYLAIVPLIFMYNIMLVLVKLVPTLVTVTDIQFYARTSRSQFSGKQHNFAALLFQKPALYNITRY